MYIWFQENEKLKAEGAEKSKKVELLNDKISDLLQKNQRYMSIFSNNSSFVDYNSAKNYSFQGHWGNSVVMCLSC